MAFFRGIQEYIARDANNIARVDDLGNIVSISGNIFLYPPKKSHPILYNSLNKWVINVGFTCTSFQTVLNAVGKSNKLTYSPVDLGIDLKQIAKDFNVCFYKFPCIWDIIFKIEKSLFGGTYFSGQVLIFTI